MKALLVGLVLLSGCYNAVGRYEMVGVQGRNILLLDTVTGRLEVQALPDVPDTLPEHKPVI